ncbi:MAG: response regulator [Candidatus Bathyarchaeota archaeon]|nr:response regulator [Candidatus Bathyarchaeota archaeon]
MTDPTGSNMESPRRNVSSIVPQDNHGETPSPRDDPVSILLVDDDKHHCDGLTALLRLSGYDVVNVYTCEDALSISVTRIFDVAIIDMVLPDVDSAEVLKEILSRDGPAGVLMLTGRTSLSHAADALNHGADAFIVKPAEPHAMIAIIERAARVKRLERELKASEARYRELFEGLGEGVFRVDANGMLVSMNQVGAEILGYASPRETLGGALNFWEPLEAKAFSENKVIRETVRFRTRTGSLVWLEVTVKARMSEHGEALGLTGIFRDVSEQVRSQEMLEAVNGLGADLGEADSLEEVGGLTLDFLKTMLGIDRGRLSVVGGELIRPLGASANPSREFHLMGHGLASKAVKTGGPQRFPDPRISLEEGPVAPDRVRYLAQLAVPILMTGGVGGAIHVSRTRGKPFSDEDVKLAEAVSEQVAMALERLVRYRIGLNHGLSLGDFL